MGRLPRGKIAVLGGSFDPLHNGHLAIARAVREQHGRDAVVLMTAPRPPHKLERSLAPPDVRHLMAEAVAREHPWLCASRLELDRQGPTFTIDTVRAVKAEVGPEGDPLFVIGGDSLAELPTWRQADVLLREAGLVVAPRPGQDFEQDLELLEQVFGRELVSGLRARVLDVPPQHVSSTEIRQMVQRGEPYDHLVPRAVAELIRKHRLYLNERSTP